MIRSCMVIDHRTDAAGELLLMTFQPAAQIVKRGRTEW
jgi:hypothetical protein